jgi:hypothetical protein
LINPIPFLTPVVTIFGDYRWGFGFVIGFTEFIIMTHRFVTLDKGEKTFIFYLDKYNTDLF